jgi:hypothetical protein
MQALMLSNIPQAALRPTAWTVWKVKAYAGKRGQIHLGQTYVRADTEQQARELGKSALRLIGVRGKFLTEASRYYPWLDRELTGFVQYTP